MQRFAVLLFLTLATIANAQLVIRPDTQIAEIGRKQAPLEIRKDGVTRVSIEDDGTIAFGANTTVDFADVTAHAGNCRGYVYVRVRGELMVMPVYTLGSDPREWRCTGPHPTSEEYSPIDLKK